jgi:hypothetical protein
LFYNNNSKTDTKKKSPKLPFFHLRLRFLHSDQKKTGTIKSKTWKTAGSDQSIMPFPVGEADLSQMSLPVNQAPWTGGIGQGPEQMDPEPSHLYPFFLHDLTLLKESEIL